VGALRAAAAGRLPADVLDAFDAEQAGLDAAGVPGSVAHVGAAMPDGALLDVSGAATSLRQARDEGPAVVVFYRGAWCPYCSLALKAYQDQLVPALAATGVPLIAISPQKPDGSLTTREQNALTFTVLSDPGNQIARKLGILTAPTEATRTAQQRLGLDLEHVNEDGTTALPMPTTVIVDAAGTIRWIDVHPNYTTRSEPAEILEALAAVVR
jgi:peroxiredoxin